MPEIRFRVTAEKPNRLDDASAYGGFDGETLRTEASANRPAPTKPQFRIIRRQPIDGAEIGGELCGAGCFIEFADVAIEGYDAVSQANGALTETERDFWLVRCNDRGPACNARPDFAPVLAGAGRIHMRKGLIHDNGWSILSECSGHG